MEPLLKVPKQNKKLAAEVSGTAKATETARTEESNPVPTLQQPAEKPKTQSEEPKAIPTMQRPTKKPKVQPEEEIKPIPTMQRPTEKQEEDRPQFFTPITPAAKPVPQYKQVIDRFDGLNRRDVIQQTESPGMTNLCSDAYPAIKTRPSRETVKAFTTEVPRAILASTKLCGVIGTDFYWDGWEAGNIKISGLAAGDKCLVDFNGNILIFPDKKYYDYINDDDGSFDCPDIDFATVHENRVFGVKGSDIYACKQGDFTQWSTFSDPPLLTDSYATDVATSGDFVGITTWGGHVEMFKKTVLHELYGQLPSNFKVLEAAKEGAVNNNTFAELEGYLFYLSPEGVKNYAGGYPELCSYNLNQLKHTAGTAGTDGDKYYASLYNGTKYELLVYDPKHGIWHKEDDLQVIGFAYYDGYLYAMATTGIYKFRAGTETVAWSYTTDTFDENTFDEKDTVRIRIQAKMAVGATLSVYASYDQSAFAEVDTFTAAAATKQNYYLTLGKRNADFFQLKLTGEGDCTIYRIEKLIEIKTEYDKYEEA